MSKSKYKKAYDVVIRFRCKTTKDHTPSKLTALLKENMNLMPGVDVFFDEYYDAGKISYGKFVVEVGVVDNA